MTEPDHMKWYKTPEGYRQTMAHYDSAFLAMKVPYESVHIDTRHGRTHVIVSGKKNGPPVVLFHGLSGNATLWIMQIEALVKNYRVYAPDTIGQMGKSATTRLDTRGPGYGEWAADTLAGLGLKRVNLIGSSNGGWLILKLATVAADKIKSAVLMSTAGIVGPNLVASLGMLLVPLIPNPSKATEIGLRMVLPPGTLPSPTTKVVAELMLAHFRLEQPPGALPDTVLKSLTAPTTVMMGQYEMAFDPYRVLDRALRLLPNLVSAEVVPGVGHDMNLDKPAIVNERLLAFLEKYGA